MTITRFKVLTTTLLTSTLLLGACGDNNDEVEENKLKDAEVQKQEEVTTEQDTTVETPEEEPKEVAFESFNLHIDNAETKDALVAQYSEEPKDSLYTNEADSANIKGEEANELLKSVLGELQLTKDMADEDVIQRITLAFGVEKYTNFNLEILYDGEKEAKTYTNTNK
ncbi:YusW family protein [Psychrobacillus antarcticus]|uniref:YusW family protein n=1 Tax=Psychrobacillus antarcticus TaxID=2879115 RepID=UPI0024081C0A|nr:YusW family protein [Psychrobacillus antarcticus]